MNVCWLNGDTELCVVYFYMVDVVRFYDVVYIMNGSGPTTDPCDTPYDTGEGGDGCLLLETD